MTDQAKTATQLFNAISEHMGSDEEKADWLVSMVRGFGTEENFIDSVASENNTKPEEVVKQLQALVAPKEKPQAEPVKSQVKAKEPRMASTPTIAPPPSQAPVALQPQTGTNAASFGSALSNLQAQGMAPSQAAAKAGVATQRPIGMAQGGIIGEAVTAPLTEEEFEELRSKQSEAQPIEKDPVIEGLRDYNEYLQMIKMNKIDGYTQEMADGGILEEANPEELMSEEDASELAPGQAPENIADDIDIKGSAGEFMMNSSATKFFGQDFLEFLQEFAERKMAGAEGKAPVEEVENEVMPRDEGIMGELADEEATDTDKLI